jgi:hypothetical protein
VINVDNPKPQYDVLEFDDIIDSYDLTENARLSLKLGCASSEQEMRQHLEPAYSNALRDLRRASVEESKDNEYLMRGETPPRLS